MTYYKTTVILACLLALMCCMGASCTGGKLPNIQTPYLDYRSDDSTETLTIKFPPPPPPVPKTLEK